jgi:Zn-dependent M28 family amino/carboxypeptidase
MLIRLLAAAALFALPAAAAAQPSASAAAEQRIRADMAFLADDLLEGREAGTRGHEIAAQYVAQQLAALGFQGAAPGGSFFQRVPFQQRAYGASGGTLTIDLPGASQTFRNGVEVAISPSLAQERDTVTAPLVFAGFGLTAPQLDHDDYAGLDARGKIVVVFAGTPAAWPGDVAAHLNGEKLRMAQAAGAIGIITIRRPTDERVFPWERARIFAGRPRLSWMEADGRPHVDAPAIRVAITATEPVGRALFAGAPRRFEALLAEAEAGRATRGFPLAGTVTIRRETSFRRFDSPNVVALLPGSDPALRDEVVVLMGHLDHLGVRPEAEGPAADRIYNGAMDNAAGIAIMIEAARALAQGPRPRRSVLILATTAEEKGLLGAEYFAENPLGARERIVAAVNMDMPILTFDLREAVGFGAEHSTLGPIAEAAMRAESVRLVPDPTPEQRSFTRSDHYPLVKAGIPSIYVDTAPTDAASRAAIDAFEARYHDVSDDLSQPIRYDSAARLARINTAIARAVANADERPRWREGSFFADTFAEGQPRAPAAGGGR